MIKDQVFEFYPKAEILQIRSESEDQMALNITRISEKLKGLNILERIKTNTAVLPAC